MTCLDNACHDARLTLDMFRLSRFLSQIHSSSVLNSYIVSVSKDTDVNNRIVETMILISHNNISYAHMTYDIDRQMRAPMNPNIYKDIGKITRLNFARKIGGLDLYKII